MKAKAIIALIAIVLVGGGLGWFVHPGAGIAAMGLLAFLDIQRKGEQ